MQQLVQYELTSLSQLAKTPYTDLMHQKQLPKKLHIFSLDLNWSVELPKLHKIMVLHHLGRFVSTENSEI
jgi:hypothetical protein